MQTLFLTLVFSLSALASPQDCADCGKLRRGEVPLPQHVAEIEKAVEKTETCVGTAEEAATLDAAIPLKLLNQTLANISVQTPFDTVAEKPEPSCAELEDARFFVERNAGRILLAKELVLLRESNEKQIAMNRGNVGDLLDQSLCALTCLRANETALMLPLDEKNICGRSCKLNAQSVAAIRAESVPGVILGRLCFQATEEKLDPKKLRALAVKGAENDAQVRLKIREFLATHLPTVRAKLNELEANQARLKKMVAKAKGRECGLDRAEKLAKETTLFINADYAAVGTGFHLRSGKRNYFASARHVSTAGSTATDAELNLALNEKDPNFPLQFEIAQGEYDYGNDAVMKEVSRKGRALELPRAGERPRFGQHFLLAGYPGSRENKFTTVRCRFVGYGPNIEGISTGYYLECPFDASLRGASGGPLLDENGRAWGIVVNHAEGRNIVVATPLAAGTDGKPEIGIQDRFSSEHCYRGAGVHEAPHACQIFPGSLDKIIP